MATNCAEINVGDVAFLTDIAWVALELDKEKQADLWGRLRIDAVNNDGSVQVANESGKRLSCPASWLRKV